MAITHKPSPHRPSSSSHIHPDRFKNLGITQPKSKKPRTEHLPTTNASLKRKIRDITRLLNGPETLPDDVRIEKERALAAYTQTIKEAKDARQRAQMIKKYHMVRFFERQKAMRRLKKLGKWMRGGEDDEGKGVDRDRVGREIKDVKVDLDYTLYCPLNKKYVSLYPRQREEDQKERRGEKPPMWEVVKKCAEEGTLEDLREGKITGKALDGERNPAKAKSKSQRARSIRGRLGKEKKIVEAGDQEDDDSESGFFSE